MENRPLSTGTSKNEALRWAREHGTIANSFSRCFSGSDNLFLSNHWRETAIPRGGAREPRKNSSSSTLPGGGLASPAYISPELTELATLWYLWYDSEGHELFCGFDNEGHTSLASARLVPIESLNLINSIGMPASQTNIPNAHGTTSLPVEEKSYASFVERDSSAENV